jgi:hypothetical protein
MSSVATALSAFDLRTSATILGNLDHLSWTDTHDSDAINANRRADR